jgi:hypothetical protein
MHGTSPAREENSTHNQMIPYGMISAKEQVSSRSGHFGRAKTGRPVARLVPLDRKPRPKRFGGGLKGRIRVPDDFNAPLDPHVIAALEGRS